jgi:hypothetical protein
MTDHGLLEEARVQALALEQELRPHDAWEAAALATVEQLIELGRPRDALRLVRELRRRDLWENARHAEIASVWRERSARAG